MDRKAVEDLGERIAEQAAHLDAATHRMLSDLRTFDQAGGWYRQGARSCAQWLSWRVGWGLGVAREHVRVATKLGELPLVDAALGAGELSYCKVRAITRVATPAIEAELVEQARFTTGAQLERICRKYAAVIRHDTDRNPNDDRQQRHVRMSDTADGMSRIEIVVHPDEASMVWAAIEQLAVARCRESVSAETSRPKHSAHLPKGIDRADAIVALAQDVLRGDRKDRAPVDVVLTVPADTLASTAAPEADNVGCFADGNCVSAETARRLSCDCGLTVVREDGRRRDLVGTARGSVTGSASTCSCAQTNAAAKTQARVPSILVHFNQPNRSARNSRCLVSAGETRMPPLCRSRRSAARHHRPPGLAPHRHWRRASVWHGSRRRISRIDFARP